MDFPGVSDLRCLLQLFWCPLWPFPVPTFFWEPSHFCLWLLSAQLCSVTPPHPLLTACKARDRNRSSRSSAGFQHLIYWISCWQRQKKKKKKGGYMCSSSRTTIQRNPFHSYFQTLPRYIILHCINVDICLSWVLVFYHKSKDGLFIKIPQTSHLYPFWTLCFCLCLFELTNCIIIADRKQSDWVNFHPERGSQT